MITGFDYVFYSNKEPFNFEKKFIPLLKEVWPNYLVEEFERIDSRLELFFSKNKQMNIDFDNNGYSLDGNGEGCFMITANFLKQWQSQVNVVDIIVPESRKNTEPYSSFFFFNKVWEYTVVLPSDIDSSDFSNNVYTHIKNLLMQDR